ncbi:MAG: TetR/AcrR family transcriptional regulator [Lachnospiraceae bacterium]|nr:TetR/AcrR family transcriptional regulator [Lachnospiraceae bacterium]
MRENAANKPFMTVKRNAFLEKGFEIFAERGIDPVAMQDVADASGYGIATLYRYFDKKPGLVVAIATWKWEQFHEENRKRRPVEGMTAAEVYEFFLDSFLELYHNNRDLLRFNQFFNIYVQSEKVDSETIRPYQQLIQAIAKWFHEMYLKAEEDHTIRTDIPEQKMFSTSLHLMLAAVTRYAVGLVYEPEDGFDAEEELLAMKEMLMERYRG